MADFRAAEKRYQLHRPPSGRKPLPHALDLADVADPDVPTPCLVPVQQPGLDAVFALADHPGAFLVRGALSPSEQIAWATLCLTQCCDPPAVTNHSSAHGPLAGLFAAAHSCSWPNRPDAASLLHRLRWAALGPPYDWTARAYPPSQPGRPVPAVMAAAAARTAALLLPGTQLRGEAALVNFYSTGDSLCGHRDDAEAAKKPLVAFSLGCPAIFLIAPDLTTAPLALLLRSGDCLLLGGGSRLATHGVPRVLTPGDVLSASELATARREALAQESENAAVAAWLRLGRINVSVRDVV